jgi:hypothetical protein
VRELRLIWLPWHAGAPPFSDAARIQLACAIRSLQRHHCWPLPRAERRWDIGDDVFTSCVRDRPKDREITYWIPDDAIIVLEVLPAGPEYREHTFLILRRMLDYRARKGRLEGSDWLEGDVAEFLCLTAEEATMVDIRVALAGRLLDLRAAHGWTQVDVAIRLGTSRSRVTRMELPDSTLSVDLFISSLLALEVTREEIGAVVAGPRRQEARSRSLHEKPGKRPGANRDQP